MSEATGDIRKAKEWLELGEPEYDLREALWFYTNANEEIEYKTNKLIKAIPKRKEDDY